MGLTGERGAQTEGMAATQHHYQITVDGSPALKHHSPIETEERTQIRWVKGSEGGGQKEK